MYKYIPICFNLHNKTETIYELIDMFPFRWESISWDKWSKNKILSIYVSFLFFFFLLFMVKLVAYGSSLD